MASCNLIFPQIRCAETVFVCIGAYYQLALIITVLHTSENTEPAIFTGAFCHLLAFAKGFTTALGEFRQCTNTQANPESF